MPILIFSNSTMPHECTVSYRVFFFMFPKKYWPLWPLININSGLWSCRKWVFLTFHHKMAQLKYPVLLHCRTFSAVYCRWNLEHLTWQVTQIDIWSLITFITRHNRFKFSVSSRPLQLDCCDESPELPSPGSQRCSCACHCIYGLHRTSLHIDIQILQAEIRYNL